MRTDSLSQSALCHDVHFALQQILEVHQQSTEIEQTTAGIHIDKKIYIALAVVVFPSHGAEQTNIMSAMAFSDGEDFLSILL